MKSRIEISISPIVVQQLYKNIFEYFATTKKKKPLRTAETKEAMSSQKGQPKKKPKHQNTYAFRHNKNSKKSAKIMSTAIAGVCLKCHQIIEWRKKYRKYKPLTTPKRWYFLLIFFFFVLLLFFFLSLNKRFKEVFASLFSLYNSFYLQIAMTAFLYETIAVNVVRKRQSQQHITFFVILVQNLQECVQNAQKRQILLKSKHNITQQ